MRSITTFAAVLGSLALAACGPGQAVVTVELEGTDPESGQTVARPLADLEVSLLPYDRDQLFDSLEAAYPEPEPPIPDSLVAARDAVAEAEEEWRQAESRWNTLRDTLQTLSTAMEQYNPAEAQYRVLFNEFNALEGEMTTVERNMEQAFQRYDELQQGIIARSDEVAAIRADWADQAFRDAAAIIDAHIAAAGAEPVFDTTDASGTVVIEAPPGEWWVHTRYELPYSELYWNEPITITREAPVEIRLHAGNAEERPNL